eukprot:scaffold327_cov257-Pinguiococcus_pyrenoidosus.AAC.7
MRSTRILGYLSDSHRKKAGTPMSDASGGRKCAAVAPKDAAFKCLRRAPDGSGRRLAGSAKIIWLLSLNEPGAAVLRAAKWSATPFHWLLAYFEYSKRAPSFNWTSSAEIAWL